MEIVHYFKINTRSGRLVFINTWNMTTIWKPSWVFFDMLMLKQQKSVNACPKEIHVETIDKWTNGSELLICTNSVIKR